MYCMRGYQLEIYYSPNGYVLQTGQCRPQGFYDTYEEAAEASENFECNLACMNNEEEANIYCMEEFLR